MPREAIAVALFALAAVSIVAPILSTSFLGDDAFNSYVDGWIARHHATLAGAFIAEFHEWDIGRGRFIPVLQVLNVVQFHFVHAPLLLKIAQVVAIGLDVGALYAVVRALLGSARRAALACAVVLLTLQTRLYFDPISQYNLHLPLSTVMALLCVLGAALYARSGRRRYFGLALANFAAATLTYEIFVPLVFALPIVLRRRPLAWIPFAVIVLIEGLAVAIIRHGSPQPAGSAYAPSVFTGAYVVTVVRQLIGTLPFSYEVFDPQSVFRNSGARWWLHFTVAASAAAIATIAALLATSPGSASEPVATGRRMARTNAELAAVGLALMGGPALLVAASPFYQRTIGLGTPYLPVFVQGFGLALCCAAVDWGAVARRAGIRFGSSFHRRWLMRQVVAVLVGVGAGMTATANGLAVGGFDSWKYPRESIVDGLAAGTAADMRDGDTLYLDRSYIVNERYEVGSVWQNVNFYRLWSGVDLRLLSNESEHAASARERNGEVFDLRSRRNDGSGGALLLARLRRHADGSLTLVDARVYERSVGASGARPARVLDGLRARDFTRTQLDGHGASWVFRPRCSQLSTDVLANDAPTRGQLRFGAGFSVEESDGRRRWRWGAGRAVLEVLNPGGRLLRTELTGSIGSVIDRAGAVTIRNSARRIVLPLDARAQPLVIPLVVPPHGSVTLPIETNAPNVAIPGDARDLRFRVLALRLIDTSGCALVDRR